jgi:hypothetical protein
MRATAHTRALAHAHLNALLTKLATFTFALNIAISSSASIFTPVSVIDLKKKNFNETRLQNTA